MIMQINKQNRQWTHNVTFWRVVVRIVAVKKQQSFPFVLLTYIGLSTIHKCSVLTWKYNEGPSLFSCCNHKPVHPYVLTWSAQSDFKQIWSSSTNVRINLQYHILRKSVQWKSLWYMQKSGLTHGQIREASGRFSWHAKAPKIEREYRNCINTLQINFSDR